MTSDEQRANWASGVGAQKDDVFVEMMENALTNVKYAGIGEAVVDLYAPELLRRFQLAAEEARNFGEALDNIRTALGQKETHYLVMADDVAVLVKTLEWYASKVLDLQRREGRLRRQGNDGHGVRRLERKTVSGDAS